MSTKSLIIDSTSTGGKKLQKSMTFINPNVANSVAGTFATMANALTTNTYQKATIVKKMDVSEQDTSGGETPTVTLNVDDSNWSVAHEIENIENGIRIVDGTGNLYIDVTYTVE